MSSECSILKFYGSLLGHLPATNQKELGLELVFFHRDTGPQGSRALVGKLEPSSKNNISQMAMKWCHFDKGAEILVNLSLSGFWPQMAVASFRHKLAQNG